MTLQQALAFGLMAATIAAFIWGKLRYDLIALAALVVGALIGVVPVGEMFSGFSNELIWIIASALLLSAAIARSGLVEQLIAPLLASLRSPSLQIPAFAGVVMLLSMVTKNVGALAIVMPIAVRRARDTGLSPSRVLLPMSFASLLGGLVTLVGTSPNIIVSGVRHSLFGQPFHMFDFTPVGLGVCVAGFAFLCIAPHFIKIERQPAVGLEAALAGEVYVTELELDEASSCVGETIACLEENAGAKLRVRALIRGDQRQKPTRGAILEEGDRLLVEGEQDALERLVASAKLHLVGERHRDESEIPADISVVEGVVRENSSLIGKSAAEARLFERFGLSLLAVSGEGKRAAQELRSAKLRSGDVLILKADQTQVGEAFAELNLLPLSERGVALGAKRFGITPALALAAAVVSVALGWVPIALAFTAAAVAVLLLRVMSMSEAYRAIEGPMLVLFAALIPISEAIHRTGGDILIANMLSHVIGPMPPYLAVAVFILVGMAVTPFLNNAATVLIIAPIAAAIARTLNVNADAYLMAVAIGAACDFLTPIGHQCNTLVFGPGGYRFSDYWKLGLPLSVIVLVTATPLILIFWPLAPR